MTDMDRDKKVLLSTQEERCLELYNGKKLIRLKSESCELLFNDEEQYAEIDAGGHTLYVDYAEDNGKISITTINGIEIEMTDPDDRITLQTAAKDGDMAINMVVLDGKAPSVTIDSNGNAMVLNGQENRIKIESGGSKFVVDGQNNRIALKSNDSDIAVDGDVGDIVTLENPGSKMTHWIAVKEHENTDGGKPGTAGDLWRPFSFEDNQDCYQEYICRIGWWLALGNH
jgi:hypothetical protein